MRTRWAIGTVAAVGMWVLLVGSAFAHCDTTSGPLIPEAKAALEKGDVTPILKWVKKDNEAEIKAAFTKTVAVRAKGPEAKELADQYFLETLVRLHRAGEGAPYTGIKDEPVEPIVAMADKALADGSADEMIKKISGHMAAPSRRSSRRLWKPRRTRTRVSKQAGSSWKPTSSTCTMSKASTPQSCRLVRTTQNMEKPLRPTRTDQRRAPTSTCTITSRSRRARRPLTRNAGQ